MKRAFLTIVFAAMPVIGLFGAATPACLAWGESTSCGSTCSSYDWCPCYRYCDAICSFRLVDERTHCAWRRTWHGPNALATPLRQYYVPRPPECSECDGYAAGYVLGNFPAERQIVDSAVVSPEAVGLSPARLERLGQIPNELDVATAAGTPARPSASGR